MLKIYVSNYLSNSISILGYETLDVEQEVFLEDSIYPHSFCIDESKNTMYIPSSITGNLYLLNLDNFEIIDNVSIGGTINNAIIHNEELFLINEDSNCVYIIDANTLKPEAMIGVDEMPHGLDIDVDNDKLYIPCSNTIVSINTETKKIDNKKETNLKSWHLKISELKSEIYVTTMEGKIIILDKNTMEIKSYMDGYILPIDIAISDINEKIYISDMGHKEIIVLDCNTKKVLERISIDGYPQGLCLINNDRYLLVSDTQKNMIRIYDTQNYELIKSVKVGKEPTKILAL